MSNDAAGIVSLGLRRHRRATPARVFPWLAFGVLALIAAAGPAHAEGDAEAGKKVFRACAACHDAREGKNKIGPSLFAVVGRTPGTADGFKYSDAMKAFGAGGKTWDAETLDAYLTNPRGVVPGTRMAFPGLKAGPDRENLIAYLESLSR